MLEEEIITEVDDTAIDEMENMYLNVYIANEVYGIEIRNVLQIIGLQEITETPEMPYYMRGYINLRGDIIPVVSMRTRFSIPEVEYNDRTCIVVTQVGKHVIGLIVDAIKETITIEPENISPPPSTTDVVDNQFISGIAKLGNNQTAVLINIEKLFVGF